MNKVEEIFKSWNIAFNPNDKQTEIASKRIEICNSCEYKKNSLGVNYCSKCGCALKAKIFSLRKNSCPEGKWNIIDNVMENNKIYVENNHGLEIFTIPQFLTDKECDYIIKLTEKGSTRSSVAGQGKEAIKYDKGRTSSTANLLDTDPVVKQVNQRICTELGIEASHSEPTQGQIYEVGQEFRHHQDTFDKEAYHNHCLSSGQRTWTFMVYLNDVEEGGETDFFVLKKTFTPSKGMAVVWKNSDGADTENPAALHAGLPVKKGKKIIITKWFRENIFNGAEDAKLAKEYLESTKPTTPVEKVFSKNEDLPRLSELGFKVTKVPEKTFQLITEAYNLLKPTIREENWSGITNFIHDNKGNSPVEILNMDAFTRIREIIAEELLPLHEEFIDNRERLIPKWIYGIRSYKRGAILEPHTDTLATHHISSIIIVDKQVDKDWPLDIQDHLGKWHKVYAEPGDMILYESATNKHGRMEPFEGEYFRNFFLHYTFADYKFIP
jgi:prolyl 4-hydroxylase